MPVTLTEQLDSLYTTTWQLMRKEAIDNIFKATPFWFWLTAKERRRTEQGGRYIGVPLEYRKNETVQSFGKGDTISTQDTDPLTMAKYDWKYVAGTIVRYYQDDQQNRGKAQIMSLAKAKFRNLEQSLIDKLEADLFGDGTGNSGKDIHGLGLLVSEDGTGVVGGINASIETWWKNKYKDMVNRAPTTYLLSDMRTMFNDCSKGNDTPTIIITDQSSYELYEDEVMEQKQIVNKELGDAMFENILFKGRPLTWSPSCPAGSMYFLNDRYLEWVADEAINFEMTDWKPAQNNLDRVAQIAVAGNLICSARSRQGVLFNIGETTPQG